MRLKRLELFGFKSFADRTVFDFAGGSLTGIVGPNGCGKSNVVDSVRWALGETRPTSLRGSGMTDVIFKGSASRPALSVADVTLVLDNENGLIEERGAEVSITRRLFRSGEGEYLIDGERVRLKDVRDMLFDTGLGSRGYSVLEQGKIDAVLSANPIQRRSIFEEAAGISRYRQRRHEADLRLKRAEQDLTRLDDVMGEMRTRVRSLKIQAGKAERFVEARDSWTSEKTRYFRHRLDANDIQLDGLRPEVDGLERDLEELRGRRAAEEADATERERERSSVVAELDRVASEAGRTAGEVRALDERRSQLALRVSAWEASATEESERAAELARQRDAEATELATMRGELERTGQATSEADAKAQELTSRARELSRGHKELRRTAQEQNDVVLARLHEKTAAQNRLRHLEESEAPAAARLERAASRRAELAGSTARLRTEADDAGAVANAMRSALEECETERRERARELEQLEGTLEQLGAERARLELERARAQSRIESLLDRDSELEDLGAGTRSVLEAVDAGEGPCGPDELQGLVADHLRTDTRLARALDAVLADRACALVAKDATVARRIVDWLRLRASGQVGVVGPGGLDVESAQNALPPLPFDVPAHAPTGGAPSNGVEGRLSDLVEYDPAIERLVRALLADAVVVRDLDVALELVRRHPDWRYVTPAGDLVDSAGLIGGHREVVQGAVGRRSTASELERSVVDVDARLATIERDHAAAAGRRDALAQELAGLDQSRDERRQGLADAEGTLGAARARLEDREASLRLLEQEEAKASEETRRLAAELLQAAEQRESAEAAFALDNERLDELESERRRSEEDREGLGRDEAHARVELARLQGDLNALERRVADRTQRLAETEAEIRRCEGRAAESRRSAEEGAREAEEVSEVATRLLEERGRAEERLEELRAFERTGAERISAARSKVEAAQSELDGTSDRLSDRRLGLQRLELAREDLLTRANEELELSEGDLKLGFEREAELAAEEALEALAARVAELKSALDRLGPVNMDAVEELSDVGGRLDFLETQSGDLVQSKRALMETIRTIDEESKRLFLETFEEVREHFRTVFRSLFGGGRADVRLEEGVDVLEAGIEIVARPPGRELLSIGLLSGGQRTLTALALLFAVFQARPSPFCILDEVDAALDDANIDRFIAMLAGFRSNTQFIVVTHNKGTMSACQMLYGITMEVKGVSRYVTVELDEVDEFAPGAAGAARDTSGTPASEDDAPDAPQLAAAEPEAADEGEPSEPETETPEAEGGSGVDHESGERLVELVPARQHRQPERSDSEASETLS